MALFSRKTRGWACLKIEIEELIREVKYRPAIWNKNWEGYTDRRLKSRMWSEVCESLIDNWRKLKPTLKQKISYEVQKKWKNVKDAFNKEVHIERKISEGLDVRKKRKYIHYEALSFLNSKGHSGAHNALSPEGSNDESDNISLAQEDVTCSVRKKIQIDDPDEDDNVVRIKGETFTVEDAPSNGENNRNIEHGGNVLDIQHETSEFTEENVDLIQKRFHNMGSYPEYHFVEIPRDNCDNEDNNQGAPKKQHESDRFTKPRHGAKVYDEDVSFSDMIVPMLRKLTDDQKHYAKVEIMNVLHKAKRYLPAPSPEKQTEKIII